jgi:hypothetical protein
MHDRRQHHRKQAARDDDDDDAGIAIPARRSESPRL